MTNSVAGIEEDSVVEEETWKARRESAGAELMAESRTRRSGWVPVGAFCDERVSGEAGSRSSVEEDDDKLYDDS